MRERVMLYQQCTAPDGQRGSFLLDVNRNRLVSPVFIDTADLFQWCRREGWIGQGPYGRDGYTRTGDARA